VHFRILNTTSTLCRLVDHSVVANTLGRPRDALQLEPATMAYRPDSETPLLAKADHAAPSMPAAVKWNKYPFFCAVLASMTSVLTCYSTYPRSLH